MTSFVMFFLAAVLFARAILAPGATGRRAPFIAACVVAAVVGVVVGPDGLILQKVIGRIALPLGLFWAVLWAVTAVRLGARNRRGARASGALAVVVTLLGSEPLGQVMNEVLEAPYQGDPFAEAPFDGVIVLGGGAQEAPHPHFELRTSGDRIFLGARLQRAGKTPFLVTTGTAIEGFQKPFDSTVATRRMWEDVGVPSAAIVSVDETRTTAQEAARCAEVIRQRGWRRVGLVTSAWHMRRAEGLFQRALAGSAVDVVPLAADHRGRPGWEGLYSLVPVGAGAWLQQKAVWEFIGAAVGR